MKNQSIYIGLGFLIIGLLLGWLFFGSGDTAKVEREEIESIKHNHAADEVWTCSMHPQIREDGPGQCPLCGMDLILVAATGADIAPEDAVQMSPAAAQIANVQTVTVQAAEPTKEIYLPGRVEADERNVGEITARFGGRIEKLFVNFTGQEVKRGQALARVYSPKLVTAQKELFEAAKFRETNPSFFEAAVNKLKLWDLSDQQIQNILASGEVRYNFNVLAPQSGTVVARNVSAGEYVQEGQSLFEVANLDQLWVVFDAYESDLPWIQIGDTVRFTVQSLPGQTFTSAVTFIDPVISPERRVAEVRTEVKNDLTAPPVYNLKPQMFAQGVLKTTLSGMTNALVIPKTAVLWTGKRAVVYVKQPDFEQPTFIYREVVLGPEAGGYYVVNKGLEAGEEIVTNGVFKVDAAAQLLGKVSMMNPTMDIATTDVATMDIAPTDVAPTDVAATDIYPEFTQQLTAVLAPYLSLKNALVASDPEAAAKAAEQTQHALTEVDINLVAGEAQPRWTEYRNVMQGALATIAQNTALETQRTALAPLSEALYQTIRHFSIKGLDAYYQYCPMADNNQGAYWISELPTIRNPYFGDNMLSCGSVKKVID